MTTNQTSARQVDSGAKMKPIFTLCSNSSGNYKIEDAISRIQKYPDDTLKEIWDNEECLPEQLKETITSTVTDDGGNSEWIFRRIILPMIVASRDGKVPSDSVQEIFLMGIEYAVRKHHGLKARPGLIFTKETAQ